MKNTKMKQSIAALAMAAVVAVSLLGYGCGSKSASTAGGVSGDFTGTAKGMGGDVTVTLTLEDGKITGCTAEGKDETPGIGTLALEQLPAQIAETGSIAVDGVSTATITSNAIKEAAAAALTAAGLNADDYKIEVKADETKAEDSTVDADVVIVGAGGAGMTAAITAAAEGKSVVIVESQPMVGGNSVRATGGMNAGKTVYQDENEFGESAGVEKTLKTAAEKYADNETITAPQSGTVVLADTLTLTGGEWMLLLCSLLFAFQIMLVDHYSPRLDGVQLSFAEFFATAVLSTIFMFVFETPTFAQIQGAAVSIAYCGILSSGVAYTLQIVGQKALDPTIASLAMCLESVFSALAGWLILGETLSTTELCGCGLMFAAIVASQLPDKKKV